MFVSMMWQHSFNQIVSNIDWKCCIRSYTSLAFGTRCARSVESSYRFWEERWKRVQFEWPFRCGLFLFPIIHFCPFHSIEPHDSNLIKGGKWRTSQTNWQCVRYTIKYSIAKCVDECDPRSEFIQLWLASAVAMVTQRNDRNKGSWKRNWERTEFEKKNPLIQFDGHDGSFLSISTILCDKRRASSIRYSGFVRHIVRDSVMDSHKNGWDDVLFFLDRGTIMRKLANRYGANLSPRRD